MTNEELLARARSHLDEFIDLEALHRSDIRKFEVSKVTEAVIFTFEAKGRTDRFRVTLDAESGAFIGAEYSPRKKS